MNFEQVKELIAMFDNSSLVNFYLELDNSVIKMKKNSKAENINNGDNTVTAFTVDSTSSISEDLFDFINSPIVGTFYSRPSPDDDEFVKSGSVVKKGDVVCIVEAMKVMNEITSSFDGTIVEVLVENGSAVEYDQPLFKCCKS